MDSFTSGCLLQALKDGADVNDVGDLYKELNHDEGGPTKEAGLFFQSTVNKEVKIKKYRFSRCCGWIKYCNFGILPWVTVPAEG